MEFNMLQEYYTYTKGVVYVLMGAILVAFVLYWPFLMGGKDEQADNDRFKHHDNA